MSLLTMSGLVFAGSAIAATGPNPAEYKTYPICPALASGHASCLAMRLAPRSAAAKARVQQRGTARGDAIGMASSAGACAETFPACLTPTDLHDAYLPDEPSTAPASEPQTIALVDAYNDPAAQTDLEIYEKTFGLNKCPAAKSSCFEQVNQEGQTADPPFPASEAARESELSFCEGDRGTRRAREEACYRVIEAEGWAVEISTDIQVSRAVCENCKILLVEASTPSDTDLEAAEETAVALKATEISNSWGSEEPVSDKAAFNHPGIPITAAAGDGGYLNWIENAEAEERGEQPYVGAGYPASSPHVVAVGGTSLLLADGTRQSETVWNDELGAGGGGCSQAFEAQKWQQQVPDWSLVGCDNRRAVADVSADADPDTGVAVYDSVPDFSEEAGKLVNEPLEWWPIGGTSVASPIIASMYALAGGGHGIAYPAETLYSHLGLPSLYDVTEGGNGQCDDNYTTGCSGSMTPLSPTDCGEGVLICNAAIGYDGPTGVGAPDGVAAFTTESEAEHETKVAEEKRIEEEARRGAAQQAKEEQEKREAAEKEAEARRVNEDRQAAESSQIAEENAAKESLDSLGLGETAKTAGTQSPSGTPSNGGPSSSSHATADLMPVIPTLSALALTHTATMALAHAKPYASQLAIAFTLDTAARVRVTIARRIVVHRHARWIALPYTLTLTAARGRNTAHLSAHQRLAPGRYRLTATPVGGKGRTLTFRVS